MSLFPTSGSRLALDTFFHLCSPSLELSRDRDVSFKQYLVFEREEVIGCNLTEDIEVCLVALKPYQGKYSVESTMVHVTTLYS